MSQLSFDLRLSLRSLARRPIPTAIVVLTLAVGLGANAAVYGVLDALVLHPIRFVDGDRLIQLAERTPTSESYERTNLSPATLLDLRATSGEVVEAVVGFEHWDANLRAGEFPEKVQGYRTSPELLATLRVEPALGRFFDPAEARAGAEPVLVLGHDLWLQLGGEASALGRTIEVDGVGHRVVGVTPPGFAFPPGAQLWAPLSFTPEQASVRDQHYLGALARLGAGVPMATADAHFRLASERRASQFADTDRDRRLVTWPLAVGMRDAGAVPIVVLWQAAGLFVLLIGWLNVANLVLARGQERERELALLDALGAGRSRLVWLQVTEGALLATAAAALALPIAAIGQWLLRDAIPAGLRRYVLGWDQLGFDLSTAGFTFGLAGISLVAVSLWPALRLAAGVGRDAGLLRASRGQSAGAGRQRGRNLLVVAEVAVALSLTVAAGLAMRAAERLLEGPQGYDPDGLVTFKLVLPEAPYAEDDRRRAFVRDLLVRLGEIPGVESAAAANVLPATGSNTSRAIALEGEPAPEPDRAPQADLRRVAGDYFATLRLPLLAGREPTPAELADGEPVAVVSRAMATRFWPGGDPLGKRFRAGNADQPWLTVVGVADDHLHHWFSRRDYPTFFVPAALQPSFGWSFAVRSERDAAELGRDLRAALAAVDAAQPLYELRRQRDQIAESSIGVRLVAGVLGTFAVLALVLAVSGVYGVTAYLVSLRAREIGVRVALGATGRDVLRATVGRAGRLAAVGLGIGLLASLGIGRLLGSVLRGVAGFEPLVASVATVLLAAAVLAAAAVPARRLLALDPAAVLRSE